MKRTFGFLWRYKQLGLAVAMALVAVGLSLLGFRKLADWVLAVTSLILLIPLVSGMWEDFRRGQYGLDVLALTAIIASVLLQQYWAAIIIVIMLTGGEALEAYAEHRARSELTNLLHNAPQKARLLRGGKVKEITAADVQTGDKLIIQTGDLVPVDAEVIDGEANLDESSLTGESLPQLKKAGDQVLSGSINLDGVLTVRAIHAARDSQYEQIIRLVRAASDSQAPFTRLADRYSIPFTVLAYLIAGAAWYLGGSAERFLEVIVVATPCPLLLAAPIALVSGMSRASKYGIIVKNGSALEKLAEIQTAAFDKTGTLTGGTPQLSAIKTYNKYSEEDVLAVAAGLEQNSNHILAQVIVEAAAAKGYKPQKAKHVRETAGHGLSAQLRGKQVLAGNQKFMDDNGVDWPAGAKPHTIRQTVTFVAIDGRLAGVLQFEDALRPETKQTLEQLRSLGVKHMLMITGDNQAAAEHIAAQVGIQDVAAGALPGDKLHIVEQITDRPVAFVGDGVNDAPVLTAADVGIALGARGSTAASESADVVIMPNDFGYVAHAYAVAKKTFAIARQSIVVGIGLSVLLMLIFATGKFTAVIGAVVQEVVDVVVIFNALRAHTIDVIKH